MKPSRSDFQRYRPSLKNFGGSVIQPAGILLGEECPRRAAREGEEPNLVAVLRSVQDPVADEFRISGPGECGFNVDVLPEADVAAERAIGSDDVERDDGIRRARLRVTLERHGGRDLQEVHQRIGIDSGFVQAQIGDR